MLILFINLIHKPLRFFYLHKLNSSVLKNKKSISDINNPYNISHFI